jgi:hypothetical protein
MKVFVVIAFVLILASLASALVFMLRGGRPGVHGAAEAKKMATALALRVAFSVTLFLVVLLLYALGYIQPTGIPVGR